MTFVVPSLCLYCGVLLINVHTFNFPSSPVSVSRVSSLFRSANLKGTASLGNSLSKESVHYRLWVTRFTVACKTRELHPFHTIPRIVSRYKIMLFLQLVNFYGKQNLQYSTPNPEPERKSACSLLKNGYTINEFLFGTFCLNS